MDADNRERVQRQECDCLISRMPMHPSRVPPNLLTCRTSFWLRIRVTCHKTFSFPPSVLASSRRGRKASLEHQPRSVCCWKTRCQSASLDAGRTCARLVTHTITGDALAVQILFSETRATLSSAAATSSASRLVHCSCCRTSSAAAVAPHEGSSRAT